MPIIVLSHIHYLLLVYSFIRLIFYIILPHTFKHMHMTYLTNCHIHNHFYPLTFPYYTVMPISILYNHAIIPITLCIILSTYTLDTHITYHNKNDLTYYIHIHQLPFHALFIHCIFVPFMRIT